MNGAIIGAAFGFFIVGFPAILALIVRRFTR